MNEKNEVILNGEIYIKKNQNQNPDIRIVIL